jgi:hypothetical protein
MYYFSDTFALTFATSGTISRNAAFGVKSILDYSAEEDMDEQKAKKLEVEATEVKIKEAKQGDFANHITKSHEKFGDRRATVVSARTHFYESEMACDKNMGIVAVCYTFSASALLRGCESPVNCDAMLKGIRGVETGSCADQK